MTFFFFLILFYTRDILTSNLLFYISQLSLIKNKIIIISLTTLFLSLSGLPPFLGFFSKFFIFSGIIFINYIFIVIFFIFYNIYSSVYYFRIIKLLIFLKIKTHRNNLFYFYVSLYLEIILKTILCLFIFSFYHINFIFKLCNDICVSFSTL